MNNRRKRRRKRAVLMRVSVLALVFAISAVMVSMACKSDKPLEAQEAEVTKAPITVITEEPRVTERVIEAIEITQPEDSSVEDTLTPFVYGYGDPDNDIYPFNQMSKDWGAEIYEEGFKFFTIPEEYKREGGCFPEVVQVYLWSLCKQRNLDYYMVVALIEHESHYQYDALGDNGNSKGYMQIYEKWHKDRMAEEFCDDLLNPYGNIRVGLNFLDEIWSQYGNSGDNCCLMVYNMGASTARNLWAQGQYSTTYSRGILARAQEIKQELTQE